MINADIWIGYDLTQLKNISLGQDMAHLVLVSNPDHHPKGDYSVDQNGCILPEKNASTYTFSGVGVYSQTLFKDRRAGEYFRTPEVLALAIAQKKIRAEVDEHVWIDVGTQERYALLRG